VTSAADMRGKRVVLTGATSGIGQATAVALAEAGADLTLVCRSPERGEATSALIHHAAPEAGIDLVIADLAIQREVRAAAAKVLEDPRPIDLLLNNAGVTHLKYTTTADGFETTFAVNHLAYFLFTQLLLDRVIASAPARIVNVASHAHKWSSMDWEHPNHEDDFAWMKVYGQSKLANILFTYELARRLEGTGVTVNCVHPGGVRTGLGAHNAPRVHKIAMWLATPFMKSPERGAQTSIYVSAAPELANVTGKYFANSREATSSKESRNPEAATRLWDLSERMTGRTPAG
jgi:NAD(P)-dependent dehydrogenase (short-subunit alcohol dehydrogenase family)